MKNFKEFFIFIKIHLIHYFVWSDCYSNLSLDNHTPLKKWAVFPGLVSRSVRAMMGNDFKQYPLI
jgi:hypothetical protein